MSQVETTPDSRASCQRIECRSRVERASPTQGRCLVENCDPSKNVQCCHLIPRHFSQLDSNMTSLEWYWGLRRSSLNLDTRYNVFLCGSTLHGMHDSSRWALLPSDEIIQQYYDTLTVNELQRYAWRQTFPNIPNNVFPYRFLPLQDMRKITIMYENLSPDSTASAEESIVKSDDESDDEEPTPAADVVVHGYPFDTMPVLISHIHPKFAIFGLGCKLASLPPNAKVKLVRKTQILSLVLELYRAWSELPPADAQTDEQFNASPTDDDDDDHDESSGDGDDPKDKDYHDGSSDRTGSRRLFFKRKASTPPSPSSAPKKSRPSGRTAGTTLRAIRNNVPSDDETLRMNEWLDRVQLNLPIRSEEPASPNRLSNASPSHSSGTGVLAAPPHSVQGCILPSESESPIRADTSDAETLLGPYPPRGHKRRLEATTLAVKKLRCV